MKKSDNSKIEREEQEVDQWLENTDLSESIAKAKDMPARRGRKPVGTKISIVLPEDLIDQLRNAADKRSIGYQTLIRIIVSENVKKYA